MAQQGLTKSVKDSAEAVPFRSLAAHKIRQYRRENELSAAALARQLEVSQPAVLYWENGQRVPVHAMQGKLQELGICSPNDWHEEVPANDDCESGAGAD